MILQLARVSNPSPSFIYGGTEEELAIALFIIETEGPSRGLFLNREKSLIYTPMNSSIVHPKLRDIPSTSVGFSLLGSPIGPSSFCEETVARRIHKVQEMVARLHDLEDSQLETTLLRSCLALPKVSHTLRTCPPCLIPKALDAFDDLSIRSRWKRSPQLVVAEGLTSVFFRRAESTVSFSSCPRRLYWLSPPMPSSGDQNQGKICSTSYTPCHLSSIPLQSCWAT